MCSCVFFFSFFLYLRGGVLTVGDALVLDLQVLVGSRAGVREDVDPGDDHTLSPVVTPGGMRDRWMDGGTDGWMDGGTGWEEGGEGE